MFHFDEDQHIFKYSKLALSELIKHIFLLVKE